MSNIQSDSPRTTTTIFHSIINLFKTIFGIQRYSQDISMERNEKNGYIITLRDTKSRQNEYY